MPTKRKYEDFQSISKANFADVVKNYQRLVYKWLRESKSPIRHWDSMSRQFFEQVWIDHKQFDRKKGNLTTWLGWQWKRFTRDAARAGKYGYEESPLRTDDLHHKRLNRKQVKTTNWGLRPQDQYDADRHSDHALVPTQKDSLWAAPYEPEEGNLGVRELIASMSEADQKLFKTLEGCQTLEEASKKLRLPHETLRMRVIAARKRLLALMSGEEQVKAKVFIVVRPDEYWQEFFRTMRETTPIHSNDWSHAAEIRTRTKWLRNRDR